MDDVRLNDANVLTRWLESVLSNANPLDRKARAAFSEVLARVKTMPDIDAVPVVHARWVKDTYNGRTCCSACKVCLPGIWYYNEEDEDENYEEIDSTPYCPNCGAKMDGGAADA